MKNYRLFLSLSILIIASLACSLFGGSAGGSANRGGTGSSSTKFPLPNNVSNFTSAADGSINFQTSVSIKDTIQFYRDSFKQQGLTERTVNTAITDTTFSLVFDGDPSGQAIVVQGVDLGDGKTNVNIRYEKV